MTNWLIDPHAIVPHAQILTVMQQANTASKQSEFESSEHLRESLSGAPVEPQSNTTHIVKTFSEGYPFSCRMFFAYRVGATAGISWNEIGSETSRNFISGK